MLVVFQNFAPSGYVSVSNFPGADPTGANDSIGAIKAALSTGQNVYLPPGNWTITAGWIDFAKPNQVFYCDSTATTITVRRTGYNPSPAVIFETTAVGAKMLNCTIDQNGGQFHDTAYLPLAWNDNITYVPGVGVTNNPLGKTYTNDGMAVAVLIMANNVEFVGQVLRGFDNDIMVADFDLTSTSVIQSLGPSSVSIHDTTTKFAGSGPHNWTPNYYMGCGIDVGTGVLTQINNVQDWYSRIGFCVDEGGGASANITQAVSHNAQMTPNPFITPGDMSTYYPLLSDPWHASSISGSGFFFGASNLSAFTGQPMAGYYKTTCSDCVALQPQGVGVWFSRFSNGIQMQGLQIIQPGLEGIWALGGTHSLNNVTIQDANFLQGSTSIWGSGLPWTQAPAVRAICANCPPFVTGGSPSATAVSLSSQQMNTTLNFSDLKITSPSGSPMYKYDLVTDPAANGNFSSINVNGGILMPGKYGSVYANSGSAIKASNLSPNPAAAIGGIWTNYLEDN